MAKPFYVEHEGPLSLILTIAGAVLFLLSLLAVLGMDLLGIGGWAFWIGAAGAILLFVGGIWFITHILKLREFKKLYAVQGKKNLLQVLDDLEYTAWRLPQKYDDMVNERKKEYKL